MKERDHLKKDITTIKEELSENLAKIEVLKSSHEEDVQEIKSRYETK
jgi:hypothetical protein